MYAGAGQGPFFLPPGGSPSAPGFGPFFASPPAAFSEVAYAASFAANGGPAAYTGETREAAGASSSQVPRSFDWAPVSPLSRASLGPCRLSGLRVVDCRFGEPEGLQQRGDAHSAVSPSAVDGVSRASAAASSAAAAQVAPAGEVGPWRLSDFFTKDARARRVLPCTLSDKDATLNAAVSAGDGPALSQFELQLRHLVTGERPPQPWLDYCIQGRRREAPRRNGEARRAEDARRSGGQEHTGETGDREDEDDGNAFIRRFLAVEATPGDLPSCPLLSTVQRDGLALLLAGSRASVGVCEGGRFSWEVKIVQLEKAREDIEPALPPSPLSLAAPDEPRLASADAPADTPADTPADASADSSAVSSEDSSVPGAAATGAADASGFPAKTGSPSSLPPAAAPEGEMGDSAETQAGTSEVTGASASSSSPAAAPSSSPQDSPSSQFPAVPAAAGGGSRAPSPLAASLLRGLVRVGVCTAEDSLFLGDSATSLGIDSEGGVFYGGEVTRALRGTVEGDGEPRLSSTALSSFPSCYSPQDYRPASSAPADADGGAASSALPFASGPPEAEGLRLSSSQAVDASAEPEAPRELPEASAPAGDAAASASPLVAGLSCAERAWSFEEGDVISVVLNMRREAPCPTTGLCRTCSGEVTRDLKDAKASAGATETDGGSRALHPGAEDAQGKPEDGAASHLPSVGRDDAEEAKARAAETGGKRKRRRNRRAAVSALGGALSWVDRGDSRAAAESGGPHAGNGSGEERQTCSCWSISFFRNGVRLLGAVKLPKACEGKILFPCVNVRGVVTVLVNFGSRPAFCPLPFWCPMLQAHPLCAVPVVFPSPHYVDLAPGAPASGTPVAPAEVTVCVGLPGCGLLDFVDSWKAAREKARGRPITEISSRALALWARATLFAEQREGCLWTRRRAALDAEKRDSQARGEREAAVAPAPRAPRHRGALGPDDQTAAGFLAEVLGALSSMAGTAPGAGAAWGPTAVGGQGLASAPQETGERGWEDEEGRDREDATWSWRGGRDEDVVAEPFTLPTGSGALDNLPVLKAALYLIAASCRRGDFLIVDILSNLQQRQRRELLAVFGAPWFSRRCLLVVGPPPASFAAQQQIKLHGEQPRLRSLIRELRNRRAWAEAANDAVLRRGLGEDLDRLEGELREKQSEPAPEAFDPSKPWINTVVDDVPLRYLHAHLDFLSLPAADEGFEETEVAWRGSAEAAEKNFQLWKQRMADRRFQAHVKPPMWLQSQLALWSEKRLAMQEAQRAVAARHARALLHLDGWATVLPADFDFGFADLTQFMKDGGDPNNSSVNKLLQALKSVDEHAEALSDLPDSSGASVGAPSFFSVLSLAGASFDERLAQVGKAVDDEVASYAASESARRFDLGETHWTPAVAAFGSFACFPSAAPAFAPSPLFPDARPDGGPSTGAAAGAAAARGSGDGGRGSEGSGAPHPNGLEAADTSSFAVVPAAPGRSPRLTVGAAVSGAKGGDAAPPQANSLELIVKEHQLRMAQVNKAVVMSQAAGLSAGAAAAVATSAAAAVLRNGDELSKNSVRSHLVCESMPGSVSMGVVSQPVPPDGRFPIFIHFEAEDWKLLDARVELHIFLHAFAQVVKENEGRLPVEWFALYYRAFLGRPFNVEDLPSCLNLQDVFELLADTVGTADEPPFVYPLFPAHTPLATFIALTEKARRIRRFKVQEGRGRKLRSWRPVPKLFASSNGSASSGPASLSPRKGLPGRGRRPRRGGATGPGYRAWRQRGGASRGGGEGGGGVYGSAPYGVGDAMGFGGPGGPGASGTPYYYDAASLQQQYMQYFHAYQQQYMGYYQQQLMQNQHPR
ncbi:hypothetical protein BESB_011150 [Besnoitia besnoiti]|uniref:Uncharacterized protein n=1 Tax=Besnoitia besnoiti TaxID=94643 RepID=A0A2A9MQV1_BESBE|nr:hypothetical protein BESB_011150 [Besnoitia besnoiti]PFH38773.1 hypothetical protein BESB_011150 [Besnoitia besnoiti]